MIKEISYSRKKILEESSPIKKTFYYGAMVTKISSIRNAEFDSEINFISFVLGSSYYTLEDYFEEEQPPFEIPKIFFDKLCEYLKQLEIKIKNKESTHTILEKIAKVSMIGDSYGYCLTITSF